MDRATFFLMRREIQKRMADRRAQLDAISAEQGRPTFAKAGVGIAFPLVWTFLKRFVLRRDNVVRTLLSTAGLRLASSLVPERWTRFFHKVSEKPLSWLA